MDNISWERSLHQSYKVLCEPKRKTKNTLPLQLRVSYIIFKYMHILFYLLLLNTSFIYLYIGLTIYMCVNSFHWIVMVIEIPKNRLIIFDSMRKPQENYQQMVNIIQRYLMSISARRISWYDSVIISSWSTMAVCRVWKRFIDREHLSGCKAPLNIIHSQVSFTS